MMRANHGFTVVEILVLVGIMGVLVALVILLRPQPIVHVEIKEVKAEQPFNPEMQPPPRITFSPEIKVEIKEVKVERAILPQPAAPAKASPPEEPRPPSIDFQRNKVDCMNNVRQLTSLLEITSRRYPRHSGPNLLLYLVKKGDLQGEDPIKLLFCPGDKNESFRRTGGVRAYRDIDLRKRGEYGSLTSYAGRDQLNANCITRKGAARAVVLVCDDSEDHHENRGMVVGLTGGAVKWRDKVRDYGIGGKRITVGEGSIVEELKCLRAD